MKKLKTGIPSIQLLLVYAPPNSFSIVLTYFAIFISNLQGGHPKKR